MNKFVTGKILGLAGLMCLLPAIGSASVVSWSLSGFTGGTVTGGASTSSETANFGFITIGSNINIADAITETYTYTGGVGTLSFKSVGNDSTYGFVAGQTFLTIVENGANLLTSNTQSATNLYQNVTSITFNDQSFARSLGQFTYSFATPAAIAGLVNGSPNFGVTSGSGGAITSAIGSMSVNTPEPSTFAMLGIALFAGLGISFRKQLALNHLSR